MPNRIYDSAKFVAQVLLPALGTLYYALAGIWNLPDADNVVGTVVSVDTFLGVVLGISNKAYKNSDARFDGAVEIEQGDDGDKRYTLKLDGHPDELDDKKEILFKVKKPTI